MYTYIIYIRGFIYVRVCVSDTPIEIWTIDIIGESHLVLPSRLCPSPAESVTILIFSPHGLVCLLLNFHVSGTAQEAVFIYLFRLALLVLYSVFEIHPCCCKYWLSVSFHS